MVGTTRLCFDSGQPPQHDILGALSNPYGSSDNLHGPLLPAAAALSPCASNCPRQPPDTQSLDVCPVLGAQAMMHHSLLMQLTPKCCHARPPDRPLPTPPAHIRLPCPRPPSVQAQLSPPPPLPPTRAPAHPRPQCRHSFTSQLPMLCASPRNARQNRLCPTATTSRSGRLFNHPRNASTRSLSAAPGSL